MRKNKSAIQVLLYLILYCNIGRLRQCFFFFFFTSWAASKDRIKLKYDKRLTKCREKETSTSTSKRRLYLPLYRATGFPCNVKPAVLIYTGMFFLSLVLRLVVMGDDDGVDDDDDGCR